MATNKYQIIEKEHHLKTLMLKREKMINSNAFHGDVHKLSCEISYEAEKLDKLTKQNSGSSWRNSNSLPVRR